MKTLRDIIALRGSKYVDEEKNPSYTEFFQGRFDGWKSAYRDLKEILEQNGFNLDVPVIGVGKTNADHIRSMTDEDLINVIPCPLGFSMFRCTIEKPCVYCKREWLKQPYGGDGK